jgi:diguanylate cyclase (GGDEF)-like protein
MNNQSSSQTSVPDDLLTDLKEQLSKLTRTNNILENLVSFTTHILKLNTVEEVLWYLADYIGRELDFEDCVIYLVDKGRGLLVQKAAFGNKSSNSQCISNPIELPIGKGIVGRCASEARPIIVDDTRQDSDYLIDDVMRLSEISVPIILDGEVIGVIDSENSQPNFYSNEHVSMLTTIANIVATKITNSHTINELEETISELEYSRKLQSTLFEIAEISYLAENLFDFGKSLHLLLSQLMNCEDCIIGIFDCKAQVLRFPYVKDRDIGIETNIIVSGDALERSITKFVIDHAEAVLLTREELVEITRNKIFDIQGAIPESWLGIPFEVDDNLRGMIAVQNFSSRYRYGQKDMELLKFVSQHISTAIKRKFDANLLQFQALHDNLTGLLNRNCFIDRVSHALERKQRDKNATLSVFFLDLDRFKMINDTYGHDVGDILIIEVGNRIKECLRHSDSLARLGGDEFAVLLEDLTDKAEALAIAQRIIENIKKPFTINSIAINSNTSVGVAFANAHIDSPDILIKHADNAMYKAKQTGKGRYVVFDASLRLEIEQELTIEQELEHALKTQQLELHYQPIIDTQDNSINAFEALLRWDHPEKGEILPSEFIAIAEKTELIYALDNYVIEKTFAFFAHLQAQNIALPIININIYSKHFLLPNFAEDFESKLDQYPGTRDHINIEITETALIENLNIARDTIEKLQAQRVGIYLDDFGTGYSSLSYIHQLPIQVIKIDRSFVSNLNQEDAKDAIIKAIITLANALGIKIVAEGVETYSQLSSLESMKCFVMQGFYFAEALTPEKVSALLNRPDDERKDYLHSLSRQQ